MSMKSTKLTHQTGTPYIGVTRAHTRAYTSDKDQYVRPVKPISKMLVSMGPWLAERCAFEVNALEGTSVLFDDWADWAKGKNLYAGTIKSFSYTLQERGLSKRDTRKRRGYRGIALKPNGITAKAPYARPDPAGPSPSAGCTKAVLALDLGTTTGWALRGYDGLITSGTVSFKPNRFDGGGMRYLRFQNWLSEMDHLAGPLNAIYFEEVRRHAGTDAAHVYGGLMAVLTAWAEMRGVPYQGVPVGTIKKSATGKGNASKSMMIEAARKRGFFPTDDNEADAIAILLWALKTQGGVA